jgi:superfamily II DNA or RNA helicase
MKVTLGMPYSTAVLDDGDATAGINKLKRHLTATMIKFDPNGNHTPTKICLFEDHPTMQGYRFRTGLFYRLKTSAPLFNLSVQVVKDERSIPKEGQLLMKGVKTNQVELWDYQQDLVNQMLKDDMGIMCAATGAGKTRMGAALVARRSVRTLYLVHTVDLLEQTVASMHEQLGIPIGVIGDGKNDPKDVTVGMVQTLINMDKVPPFDMVIADEAHHLPAETFFSVTAKFDARYVYGLSATPYRADKADMMIEAGAGPISARVSPSSLIKKGRLVRPVNRFIPVPQQTDFNRKMPGWMVYKKYIVNNDWRNAKVAEIAKQHVEKGDTFLIYVRQIEHGKKIIEHLKDFPYVTLDGKDTSERRRKVFDQLKKKEIKLVLSTLVKEGVDIPSLDAMFNAAGGTDTMQVVGRALRPAPGKTVATIYDFVDNQHINLQGASWARIKRLKEEPEFIVVVA